MWSRWEIESRIYIVHSNTGLMGVRAGDLTLALFLLLGQEFENAHEEVDEVEEELEGVHWHVLVAELSLTNHDLGVQNGVEGEGDDAKKDVESEGGAIAGKEGEQTEDGGNEQSGRKHRCGIHCEPVASEHGCNAEAGKHGRAGEECLEDDSAQERQFQNGDVVSVLRCPCAIQ